MKSDFFFGLSFVDLFLFFKQPNLVQMPSWVCPSLFAKLVQQKETSLCIVTLLTLQETQRSSCRCRWGSVPNYIYQFPGVFSSWHPPNPILVLSQSLFLSLPSTSTRLSTWSTVALMLATSWPCRSSWSCLLERAASKRPCALGPRSTTILKMSLRRNMVRMPLMWVMKVALLQTSWRIRKVRQVYW